jgi:hypothetical protein
MRELIKQRPEADWVDQDLLTRDLAALLLDEEIAAQRDALGRLSADAEARTRAQQRLDSMIAVRRGLAGPSGDQHVAGRTRRDEKGC